MIATRIKNLDKEKLKHQISQIPSGLIHAVNGDHHGYHHTWGTTRDSVISFAKTHYNDLKYLYLISLILLIREYGIVWCVLTVFWFSCFICTCLRGLIYYDTYCTKLPMHFSRTPPFKRICDSGILISYEDARDWVDGNLQSWNWLMRHFIELFVSIDLFQALRVYVCLRVLYWYGLTCRIEDVLIVLCVLGMILPRFYEHFEDEIAIFWNFFTAHLQHAVSTFVKFLVGVEPKTPEKAKSIRRKRAERTVKKLTKPMTKLIKKANDKREQGNLYHYWRSHVKLYNDKEEMRIRQLLAADQSVLDKIQFDWDMSIGQQYKAMNNTATTEKTKTESETTDEESGEKNKN